MTAYDAVVVGARCSGSIVAGLLARAGWRVALVDKARFPSDTVSTHVLFPNTLARLEELGILERLVDRHDIPFMYPRWRMLGYELTGRYTPIGGHALGTSIRRVALDAVLVEWAVEAGPVARFGESVAALAGTGTSDDPVTGVVLAGGETLPARWVIGADGRASTVASLLGLEKTGPMAGDMAYLFGYWRGLPRSEVGTLDVNDSRQGLMHNPCEDGIALLSVAGPPEITRGSRADREKVFAEIARAFPESFDARLLDDAELISDLIVVPERMMRGFYRRANGPGWALVGDAGHFKHPATAQGISDAVEQGLHLAAALTNGDGDLTGYEEWRDDRSREHYEYSFTYGTWPNPQIAEPYMRGLSSDPAAVQDWLDTFTRLRRPSELNTPERLGRWFGAPAPS